MRTIKRILIVDDNPDHRKAIREVLASCFPEAELLEAGNRREMINQLVKGTPDLLTMDGYFALPGRGEKLLGPSMIRSLRESGAQYPIIITSNDNRPRELGFEAGASASCSKEKLGDELRQALKELKLIE